MFDATIFESIIDFFTQFSVAFKSYLHNYKIVNNFLNNVNNEIDDQKNYFSFVISDNVDKINIL